MVPQEQPTDDVFPEDWMRAFDRMDLPDGTGAWGAYANALADSSEAQVWASVREANDRYNRSQEEKE